MYKQKFLKATDIWAVQMLIFIGSFYWLYKALNTHYEHKSTVHVHVKVCFKSKADYINNHILNVLKYIFNIQLIIKLQSDF
jgi:hypothetical protein